jgi:hypothetical protein
MQDTIKQSSQNLLLCLREDGREAKVANLQRFGEQDWREVVDEAARHQLMSVLFWELNQLTPEIVIPEDLHERLHQYSLQVALSNMKLYHELKIVLQAMNEADIPTIVLKGAHLAALVYPDISMRPMGDIDLMVPVERLEGGARVLEGLGYRASLGYEIATFLKLRHHLPPFVKAGERAIELHWNISVPTNPFEIDLEGVWNRAKVVQIANCETHVLSPEDLLLHLSIHAAYQHKLAFGLRPFYDLKFVLGYYRDEMKWQQALDRATAWKAAKPFFVSLQVTKDFFNVAIPDVMMDGDFADGCEVIDQAKRFICYDPKPLHDTFVEYAEQPSFYGKFVLVLKRIFINREEMSIQYGIPVTSPRRFFYYPVRAFELAKRYKGTIWRITRKDQEILVLVKENKDLLKIQKMLEPD